MNIFVNILICLSIIIFPLIAYTLFYKNKLQSKFSYGSLIIFLIGIIIVLFIPFIFWNNYFKTIFKDVFENFSSYSGFVISLFALHSIVEYFFAENNFKNITSTNPTNKKNLKQNNDSNIKYVDFKIIPYKENSTNIYFLNKKEQLLEVCDLRHSGNGDNLWFPINEWYGKNRLVYNYNKMPLWNYVSDKEEDQKEWLKQLNDFITYLIETKQIKNELDE